MAGWAYLALEDAETTLEGVHDRVVDALPLVDDIVLVDTDDDVRRGVVLTLALALVDILLRVPAIGARQLLLLDNDTTEKLDVAAGEEIEATIDVHNALARLGAGALDQLAEGTLLLLRVGGLGRARGGPEPHVGAGGQAGGVGGVEAHALHHGGGLDAALVVGAVALGAGELPLERLDEVRAGAQQHAADEVGGGDAGRALDDLEAAGLLDEAVAVVAVAVGRDVVAVDDVLAAVVRDVRQVGNVGRRADGPGDPSAGVCCGEAVAVSKWDAGEVVDGCEAISLGRLCLLPLGKDKNLQDTRPGSWERA